VTPASSSLLLRFGLALAGGMGTGFAVFGRRLFDPTAFAWQSLAIVALLSAVLALLRAERQGAALLVVAAWVLFKLGLVQSAGWTVAAAGLVLGGGVFVSALIVDLLARHGVAFGKFLALGLLVGGVMVAFTPLARFHELTQATALRELARGFVVGLVVGNGVGFGAEIADLFAGAQPVAPAPPPETRRLSDDPHFGA